MRKLDFGSAENAATKIVESAAKPAISEFEQGVRKEIAVAVLHGIGLVSENALDGVEKMTERMTDFVMGRKN